MLLYSVTTPIINQKVALKGWFNKKAFLHYVTHFKIYLLHEDPELTCMKPAPQFPLYRHPMTPALSPILRCQDTG